MGCAFYFGYVSACEGVMVGEIEMVYKLVVATEIIHQRSVVCYACEQNQLLGIEVSVVSFRKNRKHGVIDNFREKEKLNLSAGCVALACDGVVIFKPESFRPAGLLPSVQFMRAFGDNQHICRPNSFWQVAEPSKRHEVV